MKKSKTKKTKKAFTLIEVIVAVFIFALVASAASGIFVKMIQSYRYAKVVQRDLESAQYAMNLMAKTLRTSSIDDSEAFSSPGSVLIYDYSQGKCIEYTFDNNEVSFKESTSPVGGIDGCVTASYSDPNIVAENVDGRFDYLASSNGVAMGKVTISMTVKSGNRDTNIQSSVSLRDYSEAGI